MAGCVSEDVTVTVCVTVFVSLSLINAGLSGPGLDSGGDGQQVVIPCAVAVFSDSSLPAQPKQLRLTYVRTHTLARSHTRRHDVPART